MYIQNQEGVVGSSGIRHFLFVSLSSRKGKHEEADKDGIIPSIGISFGVLPERSWKSYHLGLGSRCSNCIYRCLSGGCPVC
jgi:hypothetical protein